MYVQILCIIMCFIAELDFSYAVIAKRYMLNCVYAFGEIITLLLLVVELFIRLIAQVAVYTDRLEIEFIADAKFWENV